MDATNRITDDPPENGVLKFFTTLNDSLLERLQREFPKARLVKAFNSVGAPQMVNPKYAAGKPTMFFCGNDEGGRKTGTTILGQFGGGTAGMGGATAGRAIGPGCMRRGSRGLRNRPW